MGTTKARREGRKPKKTQEQHRARRKREPDPPEGAPGDSRWLEWGKMVFWVVVLTIVLRSSVVEAYRITSGSMEDTILSGETVLGNKFIYGARLPLLPLRLPALRQPRPGDVIVFKHPVEIGERLVKRVIAVEGQQLEIRGKQVYLDGVPVPLPATGKHTDPDTVSVGISSRDWLGPVQVPPGKLFVMGDNRDNSLDSRAWGFLDRSAILAKAMFILYSWDQDDTRPFWRRIRWYRFGRIMR
jgi:signal peptidase I